MTKIIESNKSVGDLMLLSVFSFVSQLVEENRTITSLTFGPIPGLEWIGKVTVAVACGDGQPPVEAAVSAIAQGGAVAITKPKAFAFGPAEEVGE